MERNTLLSILSVLLGLIIIVFPFAGVMGAAVIIGVSIILLGLILVLFAYSSLYESKVNIFTLAFGIILFIFGILLFVFPELFVFLVSLLTYIAGIFFIVIGIINIISNRNQMFTYSGISSLILGVIYLIVAFFISDPNILGILIGLWLLIGGILNLLK